MGGFLAALLLYGLFYAAFFFQSFLTGYYIAPGDSFDTGIAAYLSSPALWTQGMYSGYPIAADSQGLTWYPVLHLFRALGVDWNIFLIAGYVVASATGFLFVRRLSGSNLAGAFSGFVCGFSGMMLGYIANFNQIHAFAWVPLAVYGLQLIREGMHRPVAAVTAVAVALMWLAGHPQIPLYAMYLAASVIAGGRPSSCLPGARRRFVRSSRAMPATRRGRSHSRSRWLAHWSSWVLWGGVSRRVAVAPSRSVCCSSRFTSAI